MNATSHPLLGKAAGGGAMLVLLLIALVAANVIFGQLRVRVDLTEEKLYTLSEGSRRMVESLPETVTLKLFFSRSAPEVPVSIKTYARQVEDLLKEYQLAGGGRIQLEIHDPKPDSEAEEWAQSFGLTPQSMDLFGQPVFFGLVAACGDTEGVLPSLDPRTERLLEYNITRLIYRVSNPDRPVIGVMSALPVLGESPLPFRMSAAPPKRPWLAFQEIQQDYDLRPLGMDITTIPSEIQSLILIHPQALTEGTAHAIDQFVLRGGHLLALLDPLNVADLENKEPDPFGMQEKPSGLEPLLNAWNVRYAHNELVADMRAVSALRGANGRVEENPIFLSLSQVHTNPDDVLTAQLNLMMLPFAGAFEVTPSEGLTVTPLLTASDMAGMVSATTARFGVSAINREFTPHPTPLHLAVRLSGHFRTAFPDGAPGGADAAESPIVPAPFLSEGRGTVILVGDADLIYDRFCVEELNFFGATALQPLNDNIHFFANAVEQIAGSADLIGIRSRGQFLRPFVRVAALEAEARRQWQEKENELVQRLEGTRQQLSQLQAQKDEGQAFILSPAQREAIAQYRDQEIAIRRELKNVRKNLRHEIEQLGLRVKLANIVLMPALVTLGGLFYGWRRRR